MDRDIPPVTRNLVFRSIRKASRRTEVNGLVALCCNTQLAKHQLHSATSCGPIGKAR